MRSNEGNETGSRRLRRDGSGRCFPAFTGRVALLGLFAAACVLARPGRVFAAQTTATVAGVSIGAPDVGDTFEVGDAIIVTLTFSAAVDVLRSPFGSAWLELSIGSRTRNATFLSGSGTASL